MARTNTNAVETYLSEGQKLKLFVVIVNVGLALAYRRRFIEECGVNLVLVLQGKGTATKEMYKMLGISEVKKDIVIAVAPATRINEMLFVTREQFLVSKRAKGVAFSVELSSIINTKLYSYLMGYLNEEEK